VVGEQVRPAEPGLGREVGDDDRFVGPQGVCRLRLVVDGRDGRRPDDPLRPPGALPEQQFLGVGVEVEHLAEVDPERLCHPLGRLGP
jgi:hypothetical protein